MNKLIIFLFNSVLVLIISGSCAMSQEKNTPKLHREVVGVFDYQKNTVSNVDFFSSNIGMNFFDRFRSRGGCFWPRMSGNQYIFAGGFWFGAQKISPQTNEMAKYVSISYNPNSGASWFVPGSIADGEKLDDTQIKKNRIYFSTDFYKYTGDVIVSDDGPSWPLWITDTTMKLPVNEPQHTYVNNIEERNRDYYPQGPLFVSDEDIYSIFKDTDLEYCEGNPDSRKAMGYPLGLEVESKIYTWEKDLLKDVIIQTYLIKNMSGNDLKDCWFGGVYDADIALKTNSRMGARNDRLMYFKDEPDMNMAVMWTDTTQMEGGNGFGYLGFSFIESPAVGSDGYIRNDKHIYQPDEQLGLVTFRNWEIIDDHIADADRYDFLSSGELDGDDGPGDKRVLIATGPFNLKAGDTARIAIAFVFALPAKGGEADGTYEDITGIKKGSVDIKDNRPVALAYNSSLAGKLKRAEDEYYMTVATSVGEDINGPSREIIASVYPNPAGNVFTINYSLKKQGQIKLSLYNQLGQEVALIAEGTRESGSHCERFMLNRNIIEDGVYYLRLQAGTFSDIRKIVLF